MCDGIYLEFDTGDIYAHQWNCFYLEPRTKSVYNLRKKTHKLITTVRKRSVIILALRFAHDTLTRFEWRENDLQEIRTNISRTTRESLEALLTAAKERCGRREMRLRCTRSTCSSITAPTHHARASWVPGSEGAPSRTRVVLRSTRCGAAMIWQITAARRLMDTQVDRYFYL